MASTYWFHGVLSPPHRCRFAVTEAVPVQARWGVLVLGDAWDVKGVQIAKGTDFDPLWHEVADLSRLVLAIYCQRTGFAIDVRIDRWTEAKATPMHDSVAGSARMDEFDPDPTATSEMQSAIVNAEAIIALGNPYWRFALYDLQDAHRLDGDDWAIYAYRAVEDCARAVGNDDDRDWRALHALMDTDEASFKNRIARVQRARDAIGHGNRHDAALEYAHANRDDLLAGLRDLVGEACERAVRARHTDSDATAAQAVRGESFGEMRE